MPPSTIPGGTEVTQETTGTTIPTGTTTPTEPTVPVVPSYTPDFSAMPEVNSEFAQVYLTDNVAVFTFIMPGMNDVCTQVVTYDLSSDTLLGQMDLCEGNVCIFPMEDTYFAVLDLNRGVFRIYDSACLLEKEFIIPNVQCPLGLAGRHENVLLISEPISGHILLVDLSTETTLISELAPDVYMLVGAYDRNFLLQSYELGLVRLSMDCSYTVLYENAYADAVGNTYAAGVQGDYMTLLPLGGGDAVMAPSGLGGEIFLDSCDAAFLCRSQHYDSPDYVQYIDTTSMTDKQLLADGMVLDGAFFGQQAVLITRKAYGEPLQFEFVDFSALQKHSLHTLAYDHGILDGREPLPAPTGSQQMLELIARYESEYGVRIVYEPDVFDVEPFGYTLTPCTEEVAYDRAVLLEKLFQFLPAACIPF